MMMEPATEPDELVVNAINVLRGKFSLSPRNCGLAVLMRFHILSA